MLARRIAFLFVFTFCVSWGGNSFTQEKTDTTTEPTDKPQPYEHQYDEAEVVEWEFCITLACSGGYAKTTRVNAPLPIPWPEQEVELYEETKSNNVGKITIKKLSGKTASIMAFAVPILRNGDSAEAILRYRVRRRSTLRPADTNQFDFAKKLNGKLKGYLKPSPYIDSRNKQIREIGKTIFADNEEQPAWDKVEAVYSWVRENIRYKFDAQPHTCQEALDTGHGDCEELSALFIAILRSRGIPARAVWVPGHTYPEFYLEDETGKGHWFPCQIAGSSHEFGSMREDRPILQKGDRFKTPVSRKTTRYVEAGLETADKTGVLKVEHLMRRVKDN
jgi:hypothetical protein